MKLFLCQLGKTKLGKGLNLEKIGVNLDEKKAIKINQEFKTSVDGIYAIGELHLDQC
ncbi:MAG: hypothetical protein CM1200mP13_03170 [Candidatus Pelagibacterales bacterium]|nr:MAG: hypothetical protein CM1200mP13_03170 [Pelagibacterales bacterium]